MDFRILDDYVSYRVVGYVPIIAGSKRGKTPGLSQTVELENSTLGKVYDPEMFKRLDKELRVFLEDHKMALTWRHYFRRKEREVKKLHERC